jgi:hypothetical protein
VANPLSADLASPYINGTNPKKKREKLPPADLEYEAWRRDMVYRIYGPQEESVKTRRGRNL